MDKNEDKQKFPQIPLRWAPKYDIENVTSVIFKIIKTMKCFYCFNGW